MGAQACQCIETLKKLRSCIKILTEDQPDALTTLITEMDWSY